MMIIFYMTFIFAIGRCTVDQSFVEKPVPLGGDVTLTCSRDSALGGQLFWIRLVVGNFPEVLAATYTFDNGGVKKSPRVTAEQEPGVFILRIFKAQLADTAFYYCEQVVEREITLLNKTFLSVKGPEADAVFPSAAVCPGDSETLQGSVLPRPENAACPGERSVFWFRAESDECVQSLPAPHKYVYNFSETVLENGTSYCAVVTCGRIFLGNGTKLDIDAATVRLAGDSQRSTMLLSLLSAALALSWIVIAVLMYIIKKRECHRCNAALQTNAATPTADHQQTNNVSLLYSVLNISRGKAVRSAGAGEGESVYSDIRVCGRE